MNALARLGRAVLDALARLGRATRFLADTVLALPALARKPGLLVRQLYAVGVLTVLIVLISGLFVGMVLGLQGYNILVRFNSESSLGVMVGLSLVRELGPVVTALLFAGRAGSALTAEIGLMKATEQLSALEMMAVDPYREVMTPRLLAGFLAMPLLAALFSAVGVLGGHLVGVELLGVDAGAYWAQMRNAVDFYDDLLSGVVKSLVFGFVATWIAVFEGYDAVPTAEGVGRATTRSVVNASLAVLGLNFVLTAIMLNGE
ncbi:MAG: ABC transporter permease [Gammaproteobacteria bacterium]|nr:MAG: ABC transporter permease [Gammaproteobacteria bacterium]